jgi:superfamily II DNA/RNA helicase
VCIYGGASKGEQIKALEGNPQVVVATPGRLLDLLGTGKLSLQGVCVLVLDEADRMLDLGFESQLRDILAAMPPQVSDALRPPPSSEMACAPTSRQTLFFTATWPANVQAVAAAFLSSPISLTVGGSGNRLVTSELVKQIILYVQEEDKDRVRAR